MLYRTLLMALTTALLGGCATLLDGLARDEINNHSVYLIPPFSDRIRSEYGGEHWRPIRFCHAHTLEWQHPLYMRFDCEIEESDVGRLQEALGDAYIELVTRLQYSLLGEFLRVDHPVCVSVIAHGTRFRRYASTRQCWHFYLPEPLPAFELLEQLDETIYTHESMRQLSFGFSLNLLLHEIFHLQTLQRTVGGAARPFGDLWLNEYLASSLDLFTQLVATDAVNQRPTIGALGTIAETPLTVRAKDACRTGADAVQEVLRNFRRARSGLGAVMTVWLAEDLATDANMMPLYWHQEFAALKTPGLGLQDVINRIPGCNPDRLVDAFALKHQLLDYDFDQMREGLPDSEVAPLPGLGETWRNAVRHGLRKDDPFEPCRQHRDSAPAQLACTGMAIDQMTLRPWHYRPAARSLPDLPELAQDYWTRYEALLGDLLVLSQESPAVPDPTPTHYLLGQDGRLRSPQGHVADTAASINVWPGNHDSACPLEGEQTVQRLNGEQITLQRCRLDHDLGVIWVNPNQSDRVVGIAALAHHRARLIADDDYAEHVEQRLPFTYQDGFPVIQLRHDRTRLNVCLDTGSPVSYITRRYRERWGLSPARLVDMLEPEQAADGHVRRVQLPLMGRTAAVRVFPGDRYPQCDLIMGSDFAGVFSALELEPRQVRLWIQPGHDG